MVLKPSEKEEAFFARQEFEQKKKIEEEKQKKLAEDQKKKEKELHFMKCPKCGMDLIEIDYKSIKVDKCSSCEGIWLDAGEMDAVATMDKTGLESSSACLRSRRRHVPGCGRVETG
jgi:Zn-finger nucleic acid-binding protein